MPKTKKQWKKFLMPALLGCTSRCLDDDTDFRATLDVLATYLSEKLNDPTTTV